MKSKNQPNPINHIFIAEAKRLVADSETTPLLRKTLEYMLKFCVGHKNAATIGKVVEHLNKRGIEISRGSFQHQVLVASRSKNLYIASGKKGIYLIETPTDAELMRGFYKERIASERNHLNHLTLLRNTKWPERKV